MKNTKIIVAFGLGLCISLLFAFKTNNTVEDQKGFGQVMVIDGKYVFTNSVPVAPYETAFEFTTKVHSFGGCPSVQDFAEASVESAKKKGFPFDAVIIGNTKYDLAIKFK